MNNSEDISPEDWDQIEGYLQDSLPPEERLLFEAELVENAALRTRVAEGRLLLQGVQEAVLREKMTAFHGLLPDAAPVRHLPRRASPVNVWWAAAAAFIVLLAATWLLLFNKRDHEVLYARYFKPDPGLITAMSATDNYAFERAMIDYKQANYTAAIQTWDSLQKGAPTNDTLTYFLGVAHLANQAPAAAIPYLKKAAAGNAGMFRDDAAWYLALALLKEGRREEALQALQGTTHTGKETLVKELSGI